MEGFELFLLKWDTHRKNFHMQQIHKMSLQIQIKRGQATSGEGTEWQLAV